MTKHHSLFHTFIPKLTAKMKLLQSVQKSFRLVGINAENQKNHKDPHDRKVLLVFSIFLLNLVFNVVYLIHEAKDFKAILQACYMIISAIYDFTLYALLVWKTVEWIQLVDNIEKLVNQSEPILNTVLCFLFVFLCASISKHIDN